MKESKNVCNECGLYEEVCECGSEQVKGIGDKFDYTEQGAGDEYLRVGEGEEDDEYSMIDEDDEEAGFVGKSDLNLGDEDDEEEEEKIIEKVNESLDMFRRFKKYN
jgi:hypothetical protein